MRARLWVRSIGTGILLALLLASLLALAAPGKAMGDEEEKFKPALIQTTDVKLDELGNAEVTFTVQYEKDSLYRKVSKLAKKYTIFISRHYGRDDTVKVVKKYRQKIDDTNKRFVLTYDSPGYAYNREDYWSIGGLQNAELTKKTNKTLEFKYDYTGRGDLTYYNDQPVRSIFRYTAPSGATSLRYDKSDGRVKYNVKPSPAGFFNENKVWLSAMFGVLALLFAGTLVLVVVNTRRKPAMAGAPAPAEPAPSSAEKESVGEIEGGVRTCRKCGKQVSKDLKFCTNCGEQL
jgi:hypothetical protein